MSNHAFSTRSIHTDIPPLEIDSTPVAPSLVQTTSFGFDSVESLSQTVGQPHAGYAYSRASNPTVDALERAVADLEGGEQAVAFSAGVAALHASLLTLLSPGDHVVAQAALYGGTQALLEAIFAPLGIETSYVRDYRNPDAWQAALRPNTKVVITETIGNPTLTIVDLAKVCELAHGVGAKVLVDSTFATPYLFRPLEHGADIVVHSATKYLGGHGDLIAGLAVAEASLTKRIRSKAILTGSTVAPFVAWLTLRGLKTLSLRMQRHVASAMEVAQFLEGRTEVRRVWYPGLPSHTDHDLAQSLLRQGKGGVVSFTIGDPTAEDAIERASEFVNRLRLFTIAGSLGDAHSLVSIPALVSHKHVPNDELMAAGIPPNLIRLSIGLEDPADLFADLKRAFR